MTEGGVRWVEKIVVWDGDGGFVEVLEGVG